MGPRGLDGPASVRRPGMEHGWKHDLSGVDRQRWFLRDGGVGFDEQLHGQLPGAGANLHSSIHESIVAGFRKCFWGGFLRESDSNESGANSDSCSEPVSLATNCRPDDELSCRWLGHEWQSYFCFSQLVCN